MSEVLNQKMNTNTFVAMKPMEYLACEIGNSIDAAVVFSNRFFQFNSGPHPIGKLGSSTISVEREYMYGTVLEVPCTARRCHRAHC